MQFRIHSYVHMGPVKATVPPPGDAGLRPINQAAVEARKHTCLGCEHLSIERCCKPCSICPRDERRNQPWARLPRCPDNRWK